MRMLSKIKLYFDRKKVLREIADQHLMTKSLDGLSSIVDDGVNVQEYEGLAQTTYPEIVAQEHDPLTASVEQLVQEMEAEEQKEPSQPTEDELKLQIINRKLGV